MSTKLYLPFLALLLAGSEAVSQTTEARLLAKVGPLTRSSIKQEAAKQTFDATLATRSG